MTPEFEEANREALEEAEFDRLVNWSHYQPERHIAEGLSDLGEYLGQGLCWLGLWIGVGMVLVALVQKLP